MCLAELAVFVRLVLFSPVSASIKFSDLFSFSATFRSFEGLWIRPWVSFLASGGDYYDGLWLGIASGHN